MQTTRKRGSHSCLISTCHSGLAFQPELIISFYIFFLFCQALFRPLVCNDRPAFCTPPPKGYQRVQADELVLADWAFHGCVSIGKLSHSGPARSHDYGLRSQAGHFGGGRQALLPYAYPTPKKCECQAIFLFYFKLPLMFRCIIKVMKTQRTIYHPDGHYDVEALFVGDEGEIWAVIECNCLIEHNVEETEMYNGWTKELPKDVQDANELAAVRDMVANHPDNAYWRNVLIALETKLEVRSDAEWLGTGSKDKANLPFTDELSDEEKRCADMEQWAKEWQDTYRSILP